MRRTRSFVSDFKACINRGNVVGLALAVMIPPLPRKTGNSCPLGWFGSGSYCVKSR